MDAVDQYNLDIGEEWPDSEDGGIAQYRRFFQVRRQFHLIPFLGSVVFQLCILPLSELDWCSPGSLSSV